MLIMVNKLMDDNTYTNKTWPDVTRIELNDINKMECEFFLQALISTFMWTRRPKSTGLVSWRVL